MTPFTLADAEAEMRAAIDSGERERIDAAAALVDRLETMPAVVTLHSAALYYVEQGLKVFPLSPRSKIPFKGSRGIDDATTDPEQVNAWWIEHPDANIGLATGHTFDVVDIDGLEGQTSRAKHWDDIFGQIDADCVAKTLTPRKGGMHIFVASTGDGNGAHLLPGVDYRGARGYVVAPPSVTDTGRYRFLGVPNFAALTKAVS